MKLYKKKETRDYILWSVIIALGIILDQITKWLSVEKLSKLDTLPLIDGILHLTYVENRGAAFGMFSESRWIFILISTVAIVGFTVYLYLGHAGSKLYEISIALVVSGGIGNMIDRLALGYVVDFIDCRFVKYPSFTGGDVIWHTFPVFNGADSFVCVGAALLMLALILDMVKEAKAERAKRENSK